MVHNIAITAIGLLALVITVGLIILIPMVIGKITDMCTGDSDSDPAELWVAGCVVIFVIACIIALSYGFGTLIDDYHQERVQSLPAEKG
jgi:hypothetical protein